MLYLDIIYQLHIMVDDNLFLQCHSLSYYPSSSDYSYITRFSQINICIIVYANVILSWALCFMIIFSTYLPVCYLLVNPFTYKFGL